MAYTELQFRRGTVRRAWFNEKSIVNMEISM